VHGAALCPDAQGGKGRRTLRFVGQQRVDHVVSEATQVDRLPVIEQLGLGKESAVGTLDAAYGIGPVRSTTGFSKVLRGASTRSPSSTGPECTATRALTLLPCASGGKGGTAGTVQMSALELTSSGAEEM
jgi:hypothetical protein